MIQPEFQKWVTALCLWKEARGEGHDGMRAVCHVIANRALRRNKSWAEIVYQPWQFSSMTASNDPQLDKVPVEIDVVIFADAYNIANAVYTSKDEDITNGADHYYANTITKPTWAEGMTATATIGKHLFFKEA